MLHGEQFSLSLTLKANLSLPLVFSAMDRGKILNLFKHREEVNEVLFEVVEKRAKSYLTTLDDSFIEMG